MVLRTLSISLCPLLFLASFNFARGTRESRERGPVPKANASYALPFKDPILGEASKYTAHDRFYDSSHPPFNSTFETGRLVVCFPRFSLLYIQFEITIMRRNFSLLFFGLFVHSWTNEPWKLDAHISLTIQLIPYCKFPYKTKKEMMTWSVALAVPDKLLSAPFD